MRKAAEPTTEILDERVFTVGDKKIHFRLQRTTREEWMVSSKDVLAVIPAHGPMTVPPDDPGLHEAMAFAIENSVLPAPLADFLRQSVADSARRLMEKTKP